MLNIVPHTYDHIRNCPTIYNNISESVFRSAQILNLVKDMLARWDSTQTVLDLISFLETPVYTKPEDSISHNIVTTNRSVLGDVRDHD